jgi:DNA (cytosine-5)-methyltransferase 1
MTFGSLFAGIGGIDLGLERAGMTCRWQVEIDPFCRRVLAKHWPDIPKYGDIRELTGSELEHVDLIAGGFPCQDVSMAGLRRGVGGGTRSGLYADMLRIVGNIRPEFVFMENVTGLLIPNEPGDPAPIARVLGDLAEIGYDAEWDCLPAAAVGAPHIRDRVWILAYPGQVSRRQSQSAGTRTQRDCVLPKGNSRSATEWGKDWELVALVPGVHKGVAAEWWRTQSRVDRSAHGIRDGVDRNCALGNAVVPQVAEWIGRRIMETANA